MRKYWEILLPLIPLLLILVAVFGGKKVTASWLGMKLNTVKKADAAQVEAPFRKGMVLAAAVKGPAQASGVVTGDVIVGINGRKINSVEQLLKARQSVLSSRGQDGKLQDVVLTLNRGGYPLAVTVPSEWVEAELHR